MSIYLGTSNLETPIQPLRPGPPAPTIDANLDRTQLGRAGELAFALYAMVSSDGELELFTPVSDEDHVDVTAGRRGGIPAIAIQVKASPGLDADGMVEARAEYQAGRVREHPAFLYAVLLMSSVTVQSAWIVPSPEFNRLGYRLHERDLEVLEFRAFPDRYDRWTPYIVPAMQIGPHLLSVIDALPEKIPPDFLSGERA
jgi:hypothetical protein